MARVLCNFDVTSTPMPEALNTNASAPANSRPLLIGLWFALIALLVVNFPAFLHTALDCDPILFDLFGRDMGRGKVLYRDMVENNTPTMIAIQSLIRMAFGHSTLAIRIVDLIVVGLGIAMLSRWFRPGRSELHLFSFIMLAALYLTTTEWCHVQRDVWLILPVMLAMNLRRAQLMRLQEGGGRFSLAVFEGLIWGSAVWMKPYVAIVGLAVWLVGFVWSYLRGARLRSLVADATGLLLGGAFLGAIGIAAMDAYGIWQPFADHLTRWGGEYRSADMYGEKGHWYYRLGFAVRNAPWSLIYMVMIPPAIVMAFQAIRFRSEPGRAPQRPETLLLATALAAWAFQAACLQHVFDYPHIVGEMFALMILIEIAAGQPTIFRRRVALAVIAVIGIYGNAKLFADRISTWNRCVTSGDSPELRDRVSKYERIGWTELDGVANYLRGREVAPGELAVVSDTALPLWLLLDQTPPIRNYIVQNNMVSFRTGKAEIVRSLSNLPNQRFLVCNLAEILWNSSIDDFDLDHPETWPLREGWYGERRWADKIVLRAGRYVILEMPSSDFPQWMADVTDN